jgi:hypothetical protein
MTVMFTHDLVLADAPRLLTFAQFVIVAWLPTGIAVAVAVKVNVAE